MAAFFVPCEFVFEGHVVDKKDAVEFDISSHPTAPAEDNQFVVSSEQVKDGQALELPWIGGAKKKFRVAGIGFDVRPPACKKATVHLIAA